MVTAGNVYDYVEERGYSLAHVTEAERKELVMAVVRGKAKEDPHEAQHLLYNYMAIKGYYL